MATNLKVPNDGCSFFMILKVVKPGFSFFIILKVPQLGVAFFMILNVPQLGVDFFMIRIVSREGLALFMIRNGLMLRRMIRSSSTGMLFGRWNGFEIENRKINLRSFNYLVLFSWGGKYIWKKIII